MEPQSVLRIVEDWLRANGFDGLYNADAECACVLGGLSPGDCLSEECWAGYKTACGCGDHDWHIALDPEKPLESKDVSTDGI